MVLERIQEPDCKRGFILDGYPRNLNQAQSLDRALRDKNSTIDSVILIEVSDKELLRRLSGRWICRSCQMPFNVVSSPPKVNGKCDRCGGELYQRIDDTEAVIKDRLKVYTEQGFPLIEYYSKVGKLKKIDGEQSIEAVGRDLLSTASAKAGRN
jgi:adenylate kinase